MLIHPKTNLDAVCQAKPALRTLFDPPKDLAGFQLLPTTPLPRMRVTRGLKEPAIYPMWHDIDEVMARQGKDYARFEGVIVLGGIGMGYLAEAIATKLGSFATLAIWEPDLEWLRAACYFRDNTSLLCNPQVQLVLGNEEALRAYIDLIYSQLALGVTTIVDTCLGDLYPKRRAVLDEVMTPFIKAQEGNRSTLIAFGEKFFTNALRSLPALATSHTVTRLKDTAKNMPAIIVGAGPGLARHQQALTECIAPSGGWNLHRTLMFAADTALHQLLEWGIHPHFVVSVDPQEETAKKYEGLAQHQGTALLYHPGAYYTIAEQWQHSKFLCPSMIPPLNEFHSLLPEDRVGNQIQCQVHLACDVAEMMGCSPIILVGIDLCYYDGDGGIYAKIPSYIVGHEEELRAKGKPEQDVNGTPVYVTAQFDQYRDGFAARAKRVRILNGNEQGVVIPGVANTPLDVILKDEVGKYWVNWAKVVGPLLEAPYPVQADQILAKLRPLMKEWRFFQLMAKNLVKRLESETLENRDLVNRWTEKFCRRPQALTSLLLLEQYGHAVPRPVRAMRLPSLADRLQAEAEWAQSRVYYQWVLEASTLALEEGRKIERSFQGGPNQCGN